MDDKCAIATCKRRGILTATLGTMNIYYCSTHEKQGNAIIDHMMKGKSK